ncbi:ATRX [Bugula neritina]|uniref:ATRX n=1 Tax=Bugula neritina TaxID=10212 RepID=A0A7J7K829_BUGNE|nr:ATRX [Bugula neritina]
MANVASAATSKQSKSSSLELLISKFKTTPLPQDPNNDSESRIESAASSGPTASGSGDHITSEKKSRRKGNPVSFVSTCAQYEIDEDMEVDEYNADLDRVSYNLTPNGDVASPPTTSESLSRPVPEEEIIPEGTIVVNPEAPSAEQEKQAPQVNPEMQGSELASGPELGSKGQAVKDPSYQCTICREPLHVKMFHNIRTHPKIKVTVCKSCYQFYTNGEFTKDEDGLDNQCSWCGEGGNLLICDFCTCAFCKKCIRNNFKRDMIKQIEEAVKWKCLICDPKPLAVHVIRCSDLQSSEYDSRIHINIPTAAGLSVNPKAKLTVNLSTIASQYINAQSVVCEDWLLESVIQEHNRFSKELKLIKESLLAAQQQCRHLLVSGDSESVREARNTYTETCRVLGTAMKRKMAESVTNNIKIISKASAKSSAAQRSPAVVSRPSVISKTQLPVQTSAGRGVSRLPLSTPVVSSLVRGGATRSEVKLRPSSHPLLTSAVTGAAAATSRTSREFIDIGELSKENSKKEKSNVEKEVINLCSDDSDDESCRRLAEGASHVSKPSADTSAASAVLSNSDLSTQSELIPKSAVDSRADSVESELIPKSAADPLCSPKSDSTDSELIPKNDAPELALQPADSCDDSDDLVGVTPRRSTRISADQASSAANDESKKKSMSDAAKHPTFDGICNSYFHRRNNY